MPPTTQRVLSDRYVLDHPVGRGAMGAVWLAEDRLLRRRVAIKEIEPPPALDATDRDVLEARVLREARAAAKLAHPGAVTVFDVVEEDGRPWIVMEYVDAPTLADIVGEEGPLSPERTAAVGLELLDVLASAHAAGIVHRDVKPGNVMCPTDGSPVKLADFGIASVQGDPKITASGLILGSPAFMSPEQAETGTSGPEADLWSLGATLYFAVEGRPPFDKGQAIPTLTAVVGEDPPEPTRAGALGPVLLELLSKDPATRPTVAEARAHLEPIAGGASFTSATTAAQSVDRQTTRVETAPEPAAVAAEPQPQVRPRPRAARPSDTRSTDGARWGLALLAVVALLLALFLIPPLFSEDDPGREGSSGRGTEGGGSGSGQRDGQDDASGDTTLTEATTVYEHPAGWTIEIPEGWVDAGNRAGDGDGTSVDLEDPVSGSYLRVEWTTEPGDDVMEALEAQEEDFAATHEGYSLLELAPYEYRDYESGLWEYTYTEGVTLHAYNLQFVTGNYGFALNFQTHEENWDSSQEIWENFQATFEPPP